jgi:ATP-dependent DNA helicase RecQ
MRRGKNPTFPVPRLKGLSHFFHARFHAPNRPAGCQRGRRRLPGTPRSAGRGSAFPGSFRTQWPESPMDDGIPIADAGCPRNVRAGWYEGRMAEGVGDEALRGEAERLLRALAGDQARLRDDQWTAIRALVADRRRTLVVQRTGWGKSAVYFIATALLRARGAGPTVIVSPLLALMRNQIAAAGRAGIHARTINSANIEEWDQIYAEVESGAADVLLVSPERLNNPDFRDLVLPKLTASAGLIVIDEAHCISDWGHDFRPDYRRLRTVIASLPPAVPILATTATANARVTRDIAEQLSVGLQGDADPAATLGGVPEILADAGGDPGGVRQGGGGADSGAIGADDNAAGRRLGADPRRQRSPGHPIILRGPLDRDSLHLAVVRLDTPAQRLGWLADNLGDLPGSGIVYTLTVAAAHDVAAFLSDRGFATAPYSGQTDPEQRLRVEDDLLAGRLKAVVATSALGMGFDKPDLGFIVHLGAPQSPVAYYQQIGRAGRAVERADVVLLPGVEDRDIWAYFASLAFPPENTVRAALAALAVADAPQSLAALEASVDLPRSRLEMMLKVLDVDGAVRRVRGGWEVTGLPWAYDAARYARVAAERAREQKAMLGYASSRGCRMQYLRRELDDPDAKPCGRCDNCTASPRSARVTAASAEAALGRLLRPGVEVAPRRMWPTGMKPLGIPVSGRIAAEVVAEPGRALGRLTDAGWGTQLRRMLAPGAPDEPTSGELFAGVVKVLASWDWPQRPAAVVTLPSRTRPTLIADLGYRIAGIGRLPYLGALSCASDAPPGGQHNSAQRLRAVWKALAVPDELRAAVAELGGPVLAVDDRIESGWTMTVAAKLLREAGAPAVLPFVLAVTT